MATNPSVQPPASSPDFPNIPNIINTDAFTNEIKKASLLSAIEDDLIKNSDDRFYLHSGLQLIFRQLFNQGIIRDNVDAIFMENSTLASTLKKNQLDAFTLVWDRQTVKQANQPAMSRFKTKVEGNFNSIISYLRREMWAVFNHPEFLIESVRPEVLRSVLRKYPGESSPRFEAPYNANFYVPIAAGDQESENDQKIKTEERKISRRIPQPGASGTNGTEPVKMSIEEARQHIASQVGTQPIQAKPFREVEDKAKNTTVFVVDSSIPTEAGYDKIINQDKTRTGENDKLSLHFVNHLLYNELFNPDPDLEGKVTTSIFVSIPIVSSNPVLDEQIRDKYRASGDKPAVIPESDYKYRGVGALFLYFIVREQSQNEVTLRILLDDINRYCRIIPSVIKDFTQGYSFEIGLNLLEESKRQARRAAVSQVMARNMSHNIGSHSLSVFTTGNALEKEWLYPLLEYKSYQGLKNNPFSCGTHPIVILEQNQFIAHKIAVYNAYLRTRMDFLADIATTAMPTLEASKLFTREVFYSFDQNTMLLNTISGVTDFRYAFTIENSSGGEDIRVVIPNDQLGCHAFYIILENIIRNTAKHSSILENEEVNFTIRLSEDSTHGDLVRVEVFSSVRQGKEENEQLVKQANADIWRPILDRGELRKGAWGILEMAVAAAYLRRIPPEAVEPEKESAYNEGNSGGATEGQKTPGQKWIDPPVLEARSFASENDSDGHLFGYRFYLLRPKEVLVLYQLDTAWTKNELPGPAACADGLMRNGIKLLPATQLGHSPDGYQYKMVVVLPGRSLVSDGLLGKLKELQPLLPNRMLIYSASERVMAEAQELPFAVPYPVAKLGELDLHALANEGKPVDKFILECQTAWARALQFRENTRVDITAFAGSIKKLQGEQLLKAVPDKLVVKYTSHGYTQPRPGEVYEPTHHYSQPLIEQLLNSANNRKGGLTMSDQGLVTDFQEAFLTRIAIIDERIQKLALDNVEPLEKKKVDGNGKVMLHEVLATTGVYVPHRDEMPLDVQDFGTENKAGRKTAETILNWFRQQAAGYHFVLIHLGIIEKLIPGRTDKDDVENFLREKVHAHIRNTRIIVISGRGKPHNLPDNELYLNYSIVARYAIEQRFKYFLTQSVFSARPLANTKLL